MTPEASQSQTPLTDAVKAEVSERTRGRPDFERYFQMVGALSDHARSLELSLQKCEQAREAAEGRAENAEAYLEQVIAHRESAESQLRALRGEKT